MEVYRPETGFLEKISVSMQNLSEKPGFFSGVIPRGVRNRFSLLISVLLQRLSQEHGFFLGFFSMPIARNRKNLIKYCCHVLVDRAPYMITNVEIDEKLLEQALALSDSLTREPID